MDKSYIVIDDLTNLQQCLYYLLQKFHEICEENNIYYVLYAGSLLGAVRHQAMIPWDDDIDVCVPREDFNKLQAIIRDKYANEFLFLSYPMKNYVYNFGKFCLKDSLLMEQIPMPYGKSKLYIDVFPVDGFPSTDEEEHFNYMRNCRQQIRKWIMPIERSKIWYKKPMIIFRIIGKFLNRIIGKNYKFYLSKMITEQEKFDFNDSEYVCLQGATMYERGKLSKNKFLNRKLYKFGNGYCYGLVDYDELLTNMYGDYMTLPPVDKRVLKHNFDLYIDKNIFANIINK